VTGARVDPQPVPVPPETVKRTGTILVVEDQAPVRMLMEEVLLDAGHHVLTAVNGLAAMKILDQNDRIDLLITDIVMPKVNGPELAAHLRNRFAHVPVLYMSGYTDDALLRSGMIDQGATFLQKPFLPEVLVSKVNDLLRTNITAEANQ
jgi:two-component system cell cycle sensor histidine kinase/response regulator CckA